MFALLKTTAFELYRRDRVLTVVALLLLAGLIPMSILAAFDTRTVMGLNPWLKPMKFAASFGVYFLTLGWLLAYLPGSRRVVRTISWFSAAGILLEMPVLAGQAARGMSSHFNVATLPDTILFYAMGVGAFMQMGMLAWALVLFCSRKVELPRLYLVGIRAGMALVLLGTLPAIAMIVLGQHNVGVADGGAGLPLVNWSTAGGDLRIAHFLGLHAIQVLPLLGFILSRLDGRIGGRSTAVFTALAGVYLFVMLFTCAQALAGQPLIAMP
jgi:hypothetical protein